MVTSDGYKLRTFRIPHGRTPNSRPGRPVLLVHGILLCSAQWVHRPADQSLAFMLADAGDTSSEVDSLISHQHTGRVCDSNV